MRKTPISRRSFVARSTVALASAATTQALTPGLAAAEAPPARQATGARVGEVTPTSAVVWTRLTASAKRIGYADTRGSIRMPTTRISGTR